MGLCTMPRLTTKIKPRSLAVVHFIVCPSRLYVGFWELVGSIPALSSMKTSLIKPFIVPALTRTYDFDQRTTPEVVMISKASSMVCVLESDVDRREL